MADTKDVIGSKPTWFVGASFGGTDDQVPRFLKEGIWENGYEDRYLDLVRSMQPGERIAVKAAYTRKNGLPFDNRGHTVSLMAIKAIGTITENLNDGRHVRVNWTKVEPVREWYFYTHRGTVWRVSPGTGRPTASSPLRSTGRLKTSTASAMRLTGKIGLGPRPRSRSDFSGRNFTKPSPINCWTIGRTDLSCSKASRRSRNASTVSSISRKTNTPMERPDSSEDICPFTTMGLFNRGLTDANRKVVAAELAKFLGVEEPVPE